MNFHLFSTALLLSALPLAALANPSISFDKGDFISAERLSDDGETIVSVKLSKSGKAKLKKLNKTHVNEKVHVEVSGVSSDFMLREPITGDGLEMGSYSPEDAKKVITAINDVP